MNHKGAWLVITDASGSLWYCGDGMYVWASSTDCWLCCVRGRRSAELNEARQMEADDFPHHQLHLTLLLPFHCIHSCLYCTTLCVMEEITNGSLRAIGVRVAALAKLTPPHKMRWVEEEVDTNTRSLKDLQTDIEYWINEIAILKDIVGRQQLNNRKVGEGGREGKRTG